MRLKTVLLVVLVGMLLITGCSNSPTKNESSPSNESLPEPQQPNTSTSLDQLKEMFAINFNATNGGATGIPPEDRKRYGTAPIIITKDGIDSLSVEDRKLYFTLVVRLFGQSHNELNEIGVEPIQELPGYWFVLPKEKAAFFWPKDNRWGEQPFPEAPKK